jgi:uroporphyrinogen-III synthase
LPEPASPARRLVLITRPREDAARTAALVKSHGYEPLAAPFLTIRTLAPEIPRDVQAIIVASGNALPALPIFPVPLLAVGDSTAARARAAGFAHVESAGRDAEALVGLATRMLRPAAGPLLLASGEGQGLRLAAALQANGFSVLRCVTYAAEPVHAFPPEAEAALRANTLHAAFFLSGETAAAFVKLLPSALRPALENVLALAIGKTAADALKPLPWRQVRLARSPTLDDVLALL